MANRVCDECGAELCPQPGCHDGILLQRGNLIAACPVCAVSSIKRRHAPDCPSGIARKRRRERDMYQPYYERR